MADPGSNYRLFGGLRFILAAMVVVSHTTPLGGGTIEAALRPWGLGNIAVMLFFCLSGYIIAEALDVFYSRRIGSFLANRALRIIPPYFAALLFSVVLHYWLASRGVVAYYDYETTPDGMFSLRNQISNILLIVVLYGLGHVGLEPDYPFVRYVWAVRVELHFYLVYAFLYWLAFVRGQGRPWAGRVMPVAVVALFLLSVAAIATNARQLNYFAFAPYFIFGVALYGAIEKGSRPAAGVAAASLALMLVHFTWYVGKAESSHVVGPAVVLLLLVASLVPLARTRVPVWVRRVDTWLGDLSYPIYLNHYAVSVAALTLLPWRGIPALLLAGVLCVAVSWLVAQLTEPFSRKLRNRIRGAVLR